MLSPAPCCTASRQLCLHLQGQMLNFLPHSCLLFCFVAFKGVFPFHLSLSSHSFAARDQHCPSRLQQQQLQHCSHPRLSQPLLLRWQPRVQAFAGQPRSLPGFGILCARRPSCLPGQAASGSCSPSKAEAWSCAAGSPVSCGFPGSQPKAGSLPHGPRCHIVCLAGETVLLSSAATTA